MRQRSLNLPAGLGPRVCRRTGRAESNRHGLGREGPLWVAENYTYAERGQRFQLDLRDRVVIFDNTAGDHFKKRTVFTDNVQMLTGIEVGQMACG